MSNSFEQELAKRRGELGRQIAGSRAEGNRASEEVGKRAQAADLVREDAKVLMRKLVSLGHEPTNRFPTWIYLPKRQFLRERFEKVPIAGYDPSFGTKCYNLGKTATHTALGSYDTSQVISESSAAVTDTGYLIELTDGRFDGLLSDDRIIDKTLPAGTTVDTYHASARVYNLLLELGARVLGPSN